MKTRLFFVLVLVAILATLSGCWKVVRVEKIEPTPTPDLAVTSEAIADAAMAVVELQATRIAQLESTSCENCETPTPVYVRVRSTATATSTRKPAEPTRVQPTNTPEPPKFTPNKGKALLWLGRWTPECQLGAELVVEVPEEMIISGTSMQFVASVLSCRAEWGNDSLKGVMLSDGSYWNLMSSFPQGSWLQIHDSSVFVCEHDDGNVCRGNTWTGIRGDSAQLKWLLENVSSIRVETFWRDNTPAPFTIIRAVDSNNAPAWVAR